MRRGIAEKEGELLRIERNLKKNREIRRISTFNPLILHKATAEALFFDNAPAVFYRLRLNDAAQGQRDLERKFSFFASVGVRAYGRARKRK